MSIEIFELISLRLIALFTVSYVVGYSRIFVHFPSVVHQESNNYSSNTSSSSQDWLLNFLGENKLFPKGMCCLLAI